jgi:hypothetical protein
MIWHWYTAPVIEPDPPPERKQVYELGRCAHSECINWCWLDYFVCVNHFYELAGWVAHSRLPIKSNRIAQRRNNETSSN